MSDKLDQSLDQILAARKSAGGGSRGRGGRRVPSTRTKATAAPAGGIQKKTKAPVKATTSKSAAPKVASSANGVDTKIIVSNLPRDVDEKQIQDYFTQSVGAVKKVWLQYGPNGSSQGRATILFAKAGSANKALEVNNGVVVDGRPMKIEIIVDATRATTQPTGPKSLSDRITNNKAAKPKSAAPKKEKVVAKADGKAVTNGKTRGTKRGRAAGRPKKKTADQLDAEMTDYFNTGAEGGATAAPAGDADTGMDEVL